MTGGITGFLMPEASPGQPAGGTKTAAPEAGLFAALLGGEVQQQMPLQKIPVLPALMPEGAPAAEPQPVVPAPELPAGWVKGPAKTAAGLSGAEIFSLAEVTADVPAAPEVPPQSLIQSAQDPAAAPEPEKGAEFNRAAAALPVPDEGATEVFAAGFRPIKGLVAHPAEKPAAVVPGASPAPVAQSAGEPPAPAVEPESAPATAVPAAPELRILRPGLPSAAPMSQPAPDSAAPAKEVAAVVPSEGLVAVKEPVAQRPVVLPAALGAPAVEFFKESLPGPVRPGPALPVQGSPEPVAGDAAKAGVPERAASGEGPAVRLMVETVAVQDAERKRTSRTLMELPAGRGPAAVETVRSGVMTPAASGAAAASAGESRAADLQKMLDTFDRHLLSLVKPGEKMTRVTLNSREMGRLTVVCREEATGLKIEIQAQSAAIQAALQRHEPAVRQLLQAHGSAVGKFDVTCDDGRGADSRREGRERLFAGEVPEDGIEPAYWSSAESEPVAVRSSVHAVSIFA